MNILDIQDKLKNFSQEQLIQEMQMPTGQLPQFLLLGEITRRKKMQDSYAQQQDQAQEQTTVAQDAINAAGMPQEAAQQLAGTMAPQTDMAGNTGAAPQQMMPQAPQPAQGMAGGGIVALQDGGRVTAPRLVVRDGRQFAEMADGSLIPMSELGYDQETPTAAASAPRGFPMDSGPEGYLELPTQADLDQRYNESRLGIDSMRADMDAPSVGDVPAIALDTAPAAPRQAPGMDAPRGFPMDSGPEGYLELPTQADLDQRYNESRLGIDSMRADMDAPSVGDVPAIALDTAPAAPRQAPGMDAPLELAPDEWESEREIRSINARLQDPNLSETDRGYLQNRKSVLEFQFKVAESPNYLMEQINRSAANLRGTVDPYIASILSRADPEAAIDYDAYSRAVISGFERKADESAEAYDARMKALGIEGDPTAAGGPTADTAPPEVQTPPSPSAEAIASAEEAAARRDELGITESLRTPGDQREAAEAARDAVTTAPRVTPPGPRGPSGGGIAGAAAQGAGAPSDFEQELMTMLAAREKRAEQDKWLALAQAGMALMSSSQPTFGGALGEAGASGLGALRESQAGSEADRLALLGQIEQSRMGRERLDLERQALAARQAASRAAAPLQDPSAFGLSTDEQRQLDIFMQLAESTDPATQLMGQQGVDELMQRVQARSNMGGAGSTPSVLAPSARSN